MALNFDRLTQEVAELKTVNESVIKLLRDTAAEIRAVAANQSRVEALADELDRTTTALAKAVEESTVTPAAPVEPAPEPVPAEEPAAEEATQKRRGKAAASAGADSV